MTCSLSSFQQHMSIKEAPFVEHLLSARYYHDKDIALWTHLIFTWDFTLGNIRAWSLHIGKRHVEG